MTAIEQAIKEAVKKGGFKPFDDEKVRTCTVENTSWVIFTTKVNIRRRIIAEIFLDPFFWQALGKARVWKVRKHRGCGGNAIYPEYPDCCGQGDFKEYWHRFIEHLAEEKDAESFFATLV